MTSKTESNLQLMLLKETEQHHHASQPGDGMEGHGQAFENLVRDHKERLYAVVYRCLGNHEDSLDIVQETFVRAHRSLEGFRGEAQPGTWLYSIAMNLARNRLRDLGRKGRNRGVSLEALEEAGVTQAGASQSPRAAAEFGELEVAFALCLDGLPELFRITFVLRLEDELDYGAIAEALDCPRGTVKSRLSQARRLLAQCLDEKGVL